MDPVAAHSCHLLQQLHEQRIQGLLCDCMLVVKGVCFKAHKNVLAAFSHYFRSLFQNSSSQKSDVFHLDVKNVSGIGQILDFMYTSQLDLNQDNIHIMLDTAQCLQVQNVLHLCHTFLKSATAEQLPGTPGNGTFSLQGTLSPESPCVLSDSYPPALLQECSPDAQPGKPGDESQCPAPLPSVSLPHCSGDGSKQAPETLDGSCSDLPFKQPSYYYKLRSLYSKHYYKQATCPSHQRTIAQPFAFSSSSDAATEENQPCAMGPSACLLESPEHLPSNFLGQPLSESAPDPEPDAGCQQPAKQMRLKKAIHLKKLSFLQSQRRAEQAADTSEAQQVHSSGGNPGEKAPSQSPEGRAEREGEDLAPSDSVAGTSEAEAPEAASSLEDPAQALQPQRQYVCELCGKPFKHPSNLELHRRSHTGEKPFECNICGKHFSQAGNLQTHLRRHSGEKPYICEICGKRFAASGDVQRHIIIHSGEKPHLCDVCGRGFSNFSNLKEHRKTHTADKVFTCDECGKSFNMQRKLVKHRVRHTGERPYSCAACGKCFGGSGDLRRHVRTHTGEKPYTCEICNKCFTRSAVLRRHKKTHALDELGPALEASDLDRSQSSDSFSQDASGTLRPVPVKLPLPAAESAFHTQAAGSYGKLRSVAPLPEAAEQGKAGLDPEKLAKLQLLPTQPQAFTYSDADGGEPLQADGTAVMRSSLAALDNCADPMGARASAAYRTSEGQFFSSMTLWGLAMKTLQNENELDQ